jgi:hypothetical protein
MTRYLTMQEGALVIVGVTLSTLRDVHRWHHIGVELFGLPPGALAVSLQRRSDKLNQWVRLSDKWLPGGDATPDTEYIELISRRPFLSEFANVKIGPRPLRMDAYELIHSIRHGVRLLGEGASDEAMVAELGRIRIAASQAERLFLEHARLTREGRLASSPILLGPEECRGPIPESTDQGE